MKPQLLKSYSSFTNNDAFKREEQIRRDNDIVRTPSITLYDIDYGIHWFIAQYIKPQIMEQGKRIDVPVMFANGELLAQIQKHGYMRENGTNKIMAPVITIRRTAVESRSDYEHLDTNLNPDNIQKPGGNVAIHKPKYNKANKYDRFSLQYATKPKDEYYITSIPEYVLVSYELTVWAEYMEQINVLIQPFIQKSGHAWGDTYKFTTVVSSFSFDDSIDAGTDRVVKATISLETKAALLMPDEARANSMVKSFSVKQVVFTSEVVNDIPVAPRVEAGSKSSDIPVGPTP
jgi:hypothetical protein